MRGRVKFFLEAIGGVVKVWSLESLFLRSRLGLDVVCMASGVGLQWT